MIIYDILFVGLLCLIVGMCSGLAIAYTFIEPRYEKLMDETIEEAETRCLQSIRENYSREEYKRKLLLQELGEALDVDVVELPSFGYVLLKGAMEINDDSWSNQWDA